MSQHNVVVVFVDITSFKRYNRLRGDCMAELTEFAKNLRRIREERKLTQSALAEMIGVTPQTISAYENGNGEKGKNPTLDKAIDLAEKLGVSLDELCGHDCKPESRAETLGDVARLLCMMWNWRSTIFFKHETIGYDACGAHDESIPAIAFDGGPIRKFLEDYVKLQRLLSEKTIDFQMFSDWVSMKINALDDISVDSQYHPLQLDSEDDAADSDGLPF